MSIASKRPARADEVLPIIRASGKLVKSVFGGEGGHEEVVHGRTDHRVSEAGSGRGPSQGAMPEERFQRRDVLQVASDVRRHASAGGTPFAAGLRCVDQAAGSTAPQKKSRNYGIGIKNQPHAVARGDRHRSPLGSPPPSSPEASFSRATLSRSMRSARSCSLNMPAILSGASNPALAASFASASGRVICTVVIRAPTRLNARAVGQWVTQRMRKFYSGPEAAGPWSERHRQGRRTRAATRRRRIAAPLADPIARHFDIGRAARPMPPIVALGDHDTTGKTRAQRDNDTEDDGLHLQAPSAGAATTCTESQ
jgi:hypothetical protein